MPSRVTSALPPRSRAVYAIAASVFVVQMAFASRYGVFRDEMYYVACGRHLAWGYVDYPPLVAVMARVATILFGHSLVGLRVLPALLAATTVLVTAELARALGGGVFAQALAATCSLATPEFLATCHFLSMNCVLLAVWPAAALCVLRADAWGPTRAWIACGILLGLGLLAKHSTLFFGAGLGAGLLLTDRRRVLLTRAPWIGLAIAAALLAPNVAWEVAHGWPTLEFMHNAQAEKMVRMGLGDLLAAEVLNMLPLTLPIWLGGLVWLLASREGRTHALLGVTFLVVLLIVWLGHGKPYYIGGAFPLVNAAGAVAAERRLRGRVVRGAVLALLPIGAAIVSPMALPVLAPDAYVRYTAALHVQPKPSEKQELGPLPQHLADQFGWEPMVRQVADAYATLTPEEQSHALVYVRNYGEAGALEFFADRYRLPPVACGHNSYYLWGPPPEGRGSVLITLGQKGTTLEESYDDVVEVGETYQRYAMPFESHKPILIARKPRVDLRANWGETKHYI